MFSNIGHKIQVLAKVVCWVGIIAAVISGIIIMASGYRGSGVLPGVLTMILGPLGAWVGSFMLYGFGELILSNGDARDALRARGGQVRR